MENHFINAENFIQTQVEKARSIFIIDTQLPLLTNLAYKILKENIYRYNNTPVFNIISFSNPDQSIRCNPLNTHFIQYMSDAHEIAEVIILNLMPNWLEKRDEQHVNDSIKVVGTIIWFLRSYNDGSNCSFPHLIEFILRPTYIISKILQTNFDIKKALEQSIAKIHLTIEFLQFHLKKYKQSGLYWVLTGEKESLLFDLQNNKSLLCLSNSIKYTSFFQVATAIVAHRVVKEVYQSNLNEVGLLLNNIDAFYLRYVSVLLRANGKKQMSLGMSVYDYKRFNKLYGDSVVTKFENNSHVHIALDKPLTLSVNYFSQARIGDNNRKPKNIDLDLNFVSVIQDIDKVFT